MLFLLFSLQFLTLVRSDDSACPVSCNCQLGQLKDLPFYHLIKDRKKPSQQVHVDNEVFYEEDINSDGIAYDQHVLMRMVTCVLQHDTDLEQLFYRIPANVEVLTLLQGSDSEDINLDFQHTHRFQHLTALEVRGYDVDEDNRLQKNNRRAKNKKGSIILHDEVMKHLKSLKYVNLQNVRLMGKAERVINAEKAIPGVLADDPLFNKISESYSLHNTHMGKQKRDIQNHITFVSSDDSDNEILPYGEYVEEQKNAGMSVFSGLSNLIFLRVFNCGLQKVNWEMFEGLEALEYLSLERNNLLFLPEFAFHGAPNLKSLSLAQNNLLNLHSTGLAGLLELEKLDLSHNNFSHLSELSLPPFPKLHTANFRHNPLEAIFASTFEIMNATTILYLGGDGSALDLQPNSFVGLQALQKLSLYNVKIDILERELLKGMPNLLELEITGKVSALAYDAFVEISLLEKLTLSHCNLKKISMDAFYGLNSLQYLDLSDNLLETLPPGLFDQQTFLRELSLRNNRLTELPLGFFRNIPAKMIRLDGNPWQCSCSMSDWQPAAINKVKQTTKKLCHPNYDKGSNCNISTTEYIYDKKVVPRCSSPKKYINWSVFHALRKGLRCAKKKHIKMRKTYIDKKYAFSKHFQQNNKMSRNFTDKHLMPFLHDQIVNNSSTTTIKVTESPITTKTAISHSHNDEHSANHSPEYNQIKHTLGTSQIRKNKFQIYDSNGEISKKAWKLEMKRKHEEKLRKYSNANTFMYG